MVDALPPYDIHAMATRARVVVAIFGMQGTGKTFLARHLVDRCGDLVDRAFEADVFVGRTGGEVWRENGKARDDRDARGPPVIRAHDDYGRHLVRPRASLVVLDECVGGPASEWNAELRHAAMSWSRSSLIAVVGFPPRLLPSIIATFDYVFLLREENHDLRWRLYYMFGGMFAGFGAFCGALDDACAEERGCLVIDVRAYRAFRFRVPDRVASGEARARDGCSSACLAFARWIASFRCMHARAPLPSPLA
jgi:hypothetical protein